MLTWNSNECSEDHHRQSHVGRAVIQLVAVQLPVKPGRPNVSSAKSFFVGQREPWILVWGCSLVWFGLGDAFVEWLLGK